jgi:hypothetical protein
MSNPTPTIDPADDLSAQLRQLDEGLPGTPAEGPPMDFGGLDVPAAGEADDASLQQVESLRARWDEEWRQDAESPVRRSDLAALLEVVGTVSADSGRVSRQLGTLLGAVRPLRWSHRSRGVTDLAALRAATHTRRGAPTDS